MSLQNFKEAIYINVVKEPDNDISFFEYKTIFVNEENISSLYKVDLAAYNPTNNDKLYFYPGCDIPRYKVRTWGKSRNITITNKESSATHIIAGKKSISGCLNSNAYMSTENSNVYCEWLDKNYTETAEIIQLKNVIEKTAYHKIFISRSEKRDAYAGLGKLSTWDVREGKTAKHYGFKSLTGDHQGSMFKSWERIDYADSEQLKKLKTMHDPNGNICSEKSVIEYVNENSAIINKSMYEEIRNLFKSTNREDQLVGLSIMSNCNVKPSLHFLLLLLEEFSMKINTFKERNHVNFKSLLKYLNLPRWDFLTVDDMMQCLMDKDELTMEIIKEVADGVKKGMQRDHNTKHFKINTITVSEDVQNHMINLMEEQKVIN
tara:strand:- start:410 stop:1537 length:1128 start_codon:yes stop_codon:yes gene_type:complete